MGIGQDLRKIEHEEIVKIAKEKNLKGGIVEDTDVVIKLARKDNEKIKEISWEKFFEIMEEKNLAVYSTNEGWMKIMKDKDK